MKCTLYQTSNKSQKKPQKRQLPFKNTAGGSVLELVVIAFLIASNQYSVKIHDADFTSEQQNWIFCAKLKQWTTHANAWIQALPKFSTVYYYTGFLSTSCPHEVLFRPSANHWMIDILMLPRNIIPVSVPLSQQLHCSSTCAQCQWGSSHWPWTPRSPVAKALSWSWGLPEGENYPVASKKAGSFAGSLFALAAHRHDGVVRPGSPPVRNTKEILVFRCSHGSKISRNLLKLSFAASKILNSLSRCYNRQSAHTTFA